MGLLNEGLFFIDERGKSVIATARRDRDNELLATEEEILQEAVEGAGWIAVFADPSKSALRMRFSVRCVQEAAITAAGALLLRHSFREVILDYKTAGWQQKNLGGGLDAATCFLTVIEKADRSLAAERFSHQRVDTEQFLKGRDDLRSRGSASVLQAWRERGGRYFDGLLPMLERLELLASSWIVALPYEEPEGVFRHIGGEFDVLLGHLNEDIAGRPLVSHPDPHYGRWLSAAYRDLAEEEEPQGLEVAFAEPLLDTQAYSALRLPWKLEDDSDLVTSLRLSVERVAQCGEVLAVA